MKIKYYKKPVLKNPYLISTWPGMGLVAAYVGMYLRKKLKFEPLGEIPPTDFFSVTDVIVKNGIASLPQQPKSLFYYHKEPDLILFIGEAQPIQFKEYQFAEIVLSIANEYNIKMLYTAAAAPVNISHKDKPDVWGVANSQKLLSYLKKFNVEIMSDGHIGGLNGLLLGVAGEKDIPGICLLGEIPIYMIEMENPKSVKAILDVLCKMLNLELDMSEIEEKIYETEKRIDEIIEEATERTREVFGDKVPELFKSIFMPQKGQDISKIFKEIKFGLPESAKEKIERLFAESKTDISKAQELKKELDKWGVYKEYEDRFLDLFKKSGGQDSSGS